MSDDDLHHLRRTMADLAEHGGTSDLYERTLRTSRRLARRRAVVSGTALAAAVLAIGVPIALVHRQQPPATPAAPAPSLSTAPSTANPLHRATPPSRPAAPRTSTTTPTTPATHNQATSRPPSSSPAVTDGCPVKAPTLQEAAHLDAGWRIKASSIRCSQGWATSELTAPTPEQQGDGLVLFKYDATTKAWKRKAEGSSFSCSEYGIPKNTGFCTAEG
ncbi:hypothetical protein [Actinoplanes sp. NPDC049681]|uniref:hypothetical protein n=1 Tax=Actinoplanes sp. NPDC049681 TaxID=3363905 RepID=UPI00379C9A0B